MSFQSFIREGHICPSSPVRVKQNITLIHDDVRSRSHLHSDIAYKRYGEVRSRAHIHGYREYTDIVKSEVGYTSMVTWYITLRHGEVRSRPHLQGSSMVTAHVQGMISG